MPHVPEVTVHSYYTFIAMDLANDRVREAERRRLLYGDVEPPERNGRSVRRPVVAAFNRFAGAVDRVAGRIDGSVDEALTSVGLLDRSRS
jgi:hypothetical protein